MIRCSNCSRSSEENKDLSFIKDEEGVVLCGICIDYFNIAKTEIEKANTATSPQKKLKPLDPKVIFNYLEKRVVGQEEAKKSISIGVSHHFRRLKDNSIGKSNILIIGPTGTGKTELSRSIAELLEVPFVSVDATSFTTKGYQGEDVDSMILKLLVSSNYDIKKAETGIIFIDEIDKLCRRGSGENSVGTTAVQQELLRIIEGGEVKVNVPSENSPSGFVPMFVNTANILFICSGAFVGLEEITKGFESKTMGIHSDSSNVIKKELEPAHIIKYGLIPELMGRLPVLATTEALTSDDLKNILTVPENSIVQQYKKLFKQDKVDISFDEEFFNEVVSKTLKEKLGARGLRQIFEKRLKPIFFDVSLYRGKRILIKKDSIEVQSLARKKKSLGVLLKK